MKTETMKTAARRTNQAVTLATTALVLASFSHPVLAEKHDHEMEQHGSHEHGVARLTVATTDDGLEIMLESPAANVFGFEHEAKSEAEHDVVHEALETLKDGSALFAVNAAAMCEPESADVESAIGEGHDDEKHAEDDDHEHGHEKEEKHEKDDHGHDKEKKHNDDEHAHEKEENHAKHEDDDKEKAEKHDDHDHDAHDDEKDSHSDVEATWAYHCDKPDAIETVTIKLFSAFPQGFETIDVEWITTSNAGKSELKEDGMIKLQP